MMEGVGYPGDEEIIGDPFQKLVILKNIRKGENKIECFMVDTLAMLRQTALIQIEQPLDIINQILFEQVELLLAG